MHTETERAIFNISQDIFNISQELPRLTAALEQLNQHLSTPGRLKSDLSETLKEFRNQLLGSKEGPEGPKSVQE